MLTPFSFLPSFPPLLPFFFPPFATFPLLFPSLPQSFFNSSLPFSPSFFHVFDYIVQSSIWNLSFFNYDPFDALGVPVLNASFVQFVRQDLVSLQLHPGKVKKNLLQFLSHQVVSKLPPSPSSPCHPIQLCRDTYSSLIPKNVQLHSEKHGSYNI